MIRTRVLLFLAWSVVAAGTGFANEVHLLAFGDWAYGKLSSNQRPVAERMERYARNHKIEFDAALLLGDNFYRDLSKGTRDRRWQTDFEEMYDSKVFSMPFYAALGNHDYEKKKISTQLAYTRENPSSRWKFPSKWYAIDFPADQPLVTVFVLDSNWSKLKDEERKSQNQWLKQQLGESKAPWTIAIAHHPLFSNGRHGDSPVLIEDWGRLFRREKLDFYVCGHDHNLQHLEIEEWPISFVVSGGGGAKLQEMRRDDRGPFSRALHGFTHLALTPAAATVRYVSVEGEIVHEFTRSPSGGVKVLRTTGRDKPKPKPKDDDKDDDD